ncbi:9136_t:CDS:2 [Funneliformis caledonium]|uniref:9136_t:CDS:1 n=1 Tax=Funneliformis caledonium TaxID=1117310 RepID=A0A9N8WE06_9GLOM|nr:9136_t:CDS:2 [Funneliformis caledonium]
MSRDNNNTSGVYNINSLTKLDTYFLSHQHKKFHFQNRNQNNFNHNNSTDTLPATSIPQTYFSSVTNDDTTSSSSCSTSELAASDQCLGDHTSDDIVSDHPDSPTTPTTPFGIHVNSPFGEPHISSYSPWLTATMPTIYENSFPQKIYTFTSHNKQKLPSSYNLNAHKIDLQQQSSPFLSQSSPTPLQSSPSPLHSSPSLSVSSRSDDLEETGENSIKDEEKSSHDDNDNDMCEDDNKGNHQRKTKEDIFLKLKLPVNGIATRTRSKKTIPSQDPPSSKKKHQKQQRQQKHQKHQRQQRQKTQQRQQRQQRHQKLPRHPLSEEEKVLLKYSNKVAEIPSFSRKVTIPSQNVSEETLPQSKNPNYPIPKSQRQVLSGWTYQEQKSFLALYLSEGKNFGLIARVLKKPIKQVVEFYYYFKMSTKFRFAKTLKKELISYSSKLDQIDNSITKLKHLSSG